MSESSSSIQYTLENSVVLHNIQAKMSTSLENTGVLVKELTFSFFEEYF